MGHTETQLLSHPGIPGILYVFVPICMPPLVADFGA